MSPEIEHGFGTGLRDLLKRKQGDAETEVVVEAARADETVAR